MAQRGRGGQAPSRSEVIARALAWFDAGHFEAELADRVAHRTESQRADSGPQLVAYVERASALPLGALVFTGRLVENRAGRAPFLIAERREGDDLPTVLTYGHGD